jgi:hypothetical protein
MAELRRERAQDRQVSAYRLGDFIVNEPEPSVEEELVFPLAKEATKHPKGSQDGLSRSPRATATTRDTHSHCRVV